MRYLHELDKSYLQGKTCLLRINLDIADPKNGDLRLNAAVPAINFLLDNGCQPLILSHRGRPKDKEPELSLKPLIDILENKIGRPLKWLENLRFDLREQANDEQFARELAAQGDFYVNDDFAVSHRRNASVAAITKFLPSFAGPRLEKEIETLSQAKDNPEKPLAVIIGGIKIDDKIGVIQHLYDKADHFLMGSAYNRSMNFELGIKDDENKIIFPSDFSSGEKLDIGPKTTEKYGEIIKTAKTIIWNGPLGKYEDERHREGSVRVAQAIADSSAFSVIGGGDTGQLITFLGLKDKFSFISTGGGAMLEFLAGKELPALKALEENEKLFPGLSL